MPTRAERGDVEETCAAIARLFKLAALDDSGIANEACSHVSMKYYMERKYATKGRKIISANVAPATSSARGVNASANKRIWHPKSPGCVVTPSEAKALFNSRAPLVMSIERRQSTLTFWKKRDTVYQILKEDKRRAHPDIRSGDVLTFFF